MKKIMVLASCLAAFAAQPAFAQQSGPVAATQADIPEKITLEYPTLIQSYVDDYYNCLKSRGHVIGDGSTFEEQHRGDIPLCKKQSEIIMAEANALLSRRGRAEETTPADVRQVFDGIGQIHISRGRDIDRQAGGRLKSSAVYQQTTANSVEVDSGQCVARVRALIDQRQAYSDENSQRIEAIYSKDEYSDEDRRALFGYQAQLRRYTGQIAYEMRKCPAAKLSEPAA